MGASKRGLVLLALAAVLATAGAVISLAVWGRADAARPVETALYSEGNEALGGDEATALTERGDERRSAESTIRGGPPPEGPAADRVRAALSKYMAAKALTPEGFGGDRARMAEERHRLIAEAMADLVALGDGAALAILHQIRAETGPVQRCFLAAGLGRIPGPKAAGACTELLREANGVEQRDLIAMMGKGRHGRTPDIFRGALDAPGLGPEERANLASAYLAQKPRDAAAFIDAMLARETDTRMRTLLISAAGASGDAGNAPALENIVRTDPDPRLREHALNAYARLAPPDATRFYGDVVADPGQSYAIRGQALRCAAGLGTDEAIAFLSEVERASPDREVRELARASLALARTAKARRDRGGR